MGESWKGTVTSKPGVYADGDQKLTVRTEPIGGALPIKKGDKFILVRDPGTPTPPTPPVAKLTFLSTQPDGTTSVSTQGTSAQGAATLQAWTLAWGDGQQEAGTGAPPTLRGHVYAAGGAFTIQLTVRDSNQMSHSASLSASIIVNPPTPLPGPTPPDPAPVPTPGDPFATLVFGAAGPISFGVPAPQGYVPATKGVQIGSVATQTDVQNVWPDGSMRFGIVRATLPAAGSYTLSAVANPGGSYTPTWPTVTVAFTIGGTTYTATLGAFDGTNTRGNGAVARQAWKLLTPMNGATPHPLLRVLVEVTSYASGGHKVNVDILNILNTAAIDAVIGDVVTTINGVQQPALTMTALKVWTGQILSRSFYVGMSDVPVQHDFELWADANVIPRVSPAVDPHVYDLNGPTFALGTYGAYIGEVYADQGGPGLRPELNPWCDWEARLFALNTEHYRQTVLAHSQLSGVWCWQISADGNAIYKVTDATVAATICTNRAAGIGNYSGLNWPSFNGTSILSSWKGAWDGGPSGVNANVDRQHANEMNFVNYLLTGDYSPLNKLRHQAAWLILDSAIGYAEPSPYLMPGYSRGRNGTRGELNDYEMGRAFGQALRSVARAAWAMPDGHADQAYFQQIVTNNLAAIVRYTQYIDGRPTPWGGSWGRFYGMHATPDPSWCYVRGNSVVSTTGASPTVLSVVGDASGIGDTNKHGMETGDFVDLAGFSGGAAALNGHHAITKISDSQFSVAVNTSGAPTSGVGTWSTIRGLKTPLWRLGITAYHVSWIGHTGLWTLSNDAWAFPDRIAHAEMAMQDNPTYDSVPGPAHQYYPSPCIVRADQLVFVESWAEFQTKNDPSRADSYLFDSESTYSVYGSSTHRGNIAGWAPAMPNNYYTIYAYAAMIHAVKRGVPGAAAKVARLAAAVGVLPALKNSPGLYLIP